jgi:Na+-driven multidrug efflux pump
MYITQVLSIGYILRFWYPLCATWIMMAIEGPLLTSVIARLHDPAFNLAAYGVAVAIAMFIESPVIMLLSTTVALAKDKRSMQVLHRFMVSVNILVTVGMLVVSIPAVYNTLVHSVIQLPDDIASLMYWGLVCMIPWPAAIGYRRYYQGLLIRNGRTRRVAYGTVVRLLSMTGTATILVLFTSSTGVVIGTVSLTSGVIFEAIATRWMAKEVLAHYNGQADEACAVPPSMREVLRFYIPLAMTSIIGFVVTPMLAFFLGRSKYPVESLAVLPVVDSFVFLFRSFGFSYQEVGIALLGENNKNYAQIKRVGLMIIAATTAALTLVAYTPLSEVLFTRAYGLSEDLAAFAVLPTMILVALPALSVLYSLQRSVLIVARKNIVVTWSTIIEVGWILVSMLVVLAVFDLPGAVAAAIAMLAGRVLANGYLAVKTRQTLMKHQ